nr:methylaspartate mutase [Streptomyces spiramenti]
MVVQPRMGFGSPALMRAGLRATRDAEATTVGTLTLDSYTRVGDLAAARGAAADGSDLNGYPLVTAAAHDTRWMLGGLAGPDFPVQVRHGSAVPQDIFRALVRAGLDATEGGPVSYCLPYGRVPLSTSLSNWTDSCLILAPLREQGREPHLETFGGCMLGQLCPPSQLVAISVLEALFFTRLGVRSVSASYAQQTSPEQDREAVAALRRLCTELLPRDSVDWHIVIYAYMGVFPGTVGGARALLRSAAELATLTGAERLIVKTVVESRRIPTIAENADALELAARSAENVRGAAKALGARVDDAPTAAPATDADSQVYQEAAALVEAVLNLDADLGRALAHAFRCGYLDIPYCLHPDNAGRARSYLDTAGRLQWAELGSLPLRHLVRARSAAPVTSGELLTALGYVQRTFDSMADDDPAGGSHDATAQGEPR